MAKYQGEMEERKEPKFVKFEMGEQVAGVLVNIEKIEMKDGGSSIRYTIEDEGEPHWVVTHGWFIADTLSLGRWIAWDDHGRYADAPVDMVWLVERGLTPVQTWRNY